METMKSNVLTGKEFFQLTVNSLLELCTHCIDGHRIVSIEGSVLLTLDTGDKLKLNILQQDINKFLKSVKADDTNKSCSAATLDVDKKFEDIKPKNAETGAPVEDNVDVENVNNVHVNKADTSGSTDETNLHSSFMDSGEQNVSFDASMPSAVLQTNGEFMCSSCGETMKCARAIKQHILAHNSQLPLESSTSPCLDKKNEITKHKVMRRLPRKKRSGYKRLPKRESNADKAIGWQCYPCKDCEIIFASSSLMYKHRIQVHYQHKCEKCGMVLAGRRNFSQHVRKEHPGALICLKSFVCEYCSRTFDVEKNMKDHIATVHLGSVEHRCDQCGKVLGSAVTLKIHQRQLHERRFVRTCDGCGLQFTRLAGLIGHLARTHPHLLPDKYRCQLEEFTCQKCDMRFSRRRSLQNHLEARHGGAPKYMCPICSRRFGCRRYVLRHIRIHHPSIAAADGKMSAMPVPVDLGNDNSTSVSEVLQQATNDSSTAQL